MCDVPALYVLAQEQNIEVLEYSMPINGSMSIMTSSGQCYIGLDPHIRDGSTQERVHIGHELGHCITGSFYSIHTAVDCRQRHENKADKWAIRQLIPVEQLDEAVAEGCTEIWDLAEHFGVTELFIRKALCLYAHGNVADELYF
jgi:hypothetical protein